MRAIALVLIAGCTEGEATLAIPSLGTEFALFGTASEGRGIAASSVQVKRISEIESITPEQIGGGNIDMSFVGLDPVDFPRDLSPEQLVFVSSNDERARPLPAIYAPHVFEEPVLPGDPAVFVRVDQPSVPRELLADREHRLELMLAGFAIENPCRDPITEFSIFTPRIPAELIFTMRTVSSGDTIIGFAATSTAIIGVLGPSDEDPDIIGVTTSTATPVLLGEVAVVTDLGDTEISHEGRTLPGELAINVEGGFGSVGSVAFWDPAKRRWIDDTPPLADAFPRSLFGARHVMIDGIASICTFGGTQGADRSAAVWCRAASGGEWTVRARFGKKFAVRALEAGTDALLAFDLSGTVYEHRGSDDWNPIFSSALNAGCDPLCTNFGAFTLAGKSDLFGVMAGGKAQVLLLEPAGGTLRASEPEIVPEALFSDERVDAEEPKRFTAVGVAPDGAIWLGTDAPDLLRINPERTTVERICLPKDLNDTQIASIEAHPNGRLILGLAPAIFAFTDWRL